MHGQAGEVGRKATGRGRALRRGALAAIALGAAAGAGAVLYELHSSTLQAHLLADLGRKLTFAVEPGPSPTVRFPQSAPYDDRMGYSRLPDFI